MIGSPLGSNRSGELAARRQVLLPQHATIIIVSYKKPRIPGLDRPERPDSRATYPRRCILAIARRRRVSTISTRQYAFAFTAFRLPQGDSHRTDTWPRRNAD